MKKPPFFSSKILDKDIKLKGVDYNRVSPLVEMAGIEPASESLCSQTSTSLACCSFHRKRPQLAQVHFRLATRTRKPLFRRISSIPYGTLAL